MKFKKILATIIALTAVTIPMSVNAGGKLTSNYYLGDANGDTLRIIVYGGVITEENEAEAVDGIVSYKGSPTNLNIPQIMKLTPEDPNDEDLQYTQNILHMYEDIEMCNVLENAFADCSSLKTVELTGNYVMPGGFKNCTNLESVTFNSSPYIKSKTNSERSSNVSEKGFENCTSLKKLIIKGKTAPTFNHGAFENCPVETVILPEKYDDYVKPVETTNEDGTTSVNFSKTTYRMPNFSDFKSLKTINIPYGTYALLSTFSGCTSLEKIEIPETVGTLVGSFKNCTNLKEVKFLGNESPIRKNTFEGCPNVTVVCNADSMTAETCKEYGVHAVDFNGKTISEGSAASVQASAAPSSNKDIIRVILNGSALSFTQSPVIINGTTLVPMRAIFEAMGASVDWDGTTRTVTSAKGDTTISLTIDKETAAVNGNKISLAVPAKLINGSTMVPLRFVSESLGAEVNWDGGTKTVTIKG